MTEWCIMTLFSQFTDFTAPRIAKTRKYRKLIIFSDLRESPLLWYDITLSFRVRLAWHWSFWTWRWRMGFPNDTHLIWKGIGSFWRKPWAKYYKALFNDSPTDRDFLSFTSVRQKRLYARKLHDAAALRVHILKSFPALWWRFGIFVKPIRPTNPLPKN